MRPHWLPLGFLLTGVLFFPACGTKPAPETVVPEQATWIPNGWDYAERGEYYHLPEGSELMPYVVLDNIASVKTGKPFLEDMERFGFTADAQSTLNPHGLPIGLTSVRSREQSITGLEMVGFNCAACHVGKMTYRGRSVIIDGAPSLIDLQGYQIELKDSLEATLKNPAKTIALIVEIDREMRAADTPSGSKAAAYQSDAAVKDAANAEAGSAADTKFRSVPSATADSTRPTVPSGLLTFADRMKWDIAFLKARLAYLKNGKLLIDGTEPGPGRVDAFGAARNLLFPKDAIRMQSPVSFPFIWDVPDTIQQRTPGEEVWIHYDANTNSVLERNIGQALGMGAVFDPVTYQSTLRIANLHELEVLTHKLKSPVWPEQILGSIDKSKTKLGEQIFDTTCADCHRNRLFALTDVGTDPNRANSFGQPVGKIPFPAAVKPILDALKARAFADDNIPASAQAEMDAPNVVWRATGQYYARPLHGAWATAPYLHNGSVPTLWDLLHPDKRPAKFTLGNHEYDPVKLGYVTTPSARGEAWTYDTAQSGNSNVGHTYGANLTEEQKAALLEYLKTI
ncbi:MAG: hypothetical protein KGN84_22440 [Acidobacteriota bacterium]|nr:hypothetical protein [Acidobacteriota bacterium]